MENEKDLVTPDPGLMKVWRTIKQLEGGKYEDRTGDGGSSAGAFQWNNQPEGKSVPLKDGELPSNWKKAAKTVLGDENAPMSVANQNKVSYKQLEAYKNAGHDPEEIDALWNGAHKDKTTGKYVHNSTERQRIFRNALLNQVDEQQNTPVSPQNAPEQAEPSLLGQLGDRLQQAVGYGDNNPNKTGVELAASAFQKDETPGIADNVGRAAMGVADVAGAIGGGIGDVVGAVIGGGVSYLDRKLFNNKISKTTEAVLSNPEVKEGIEKYQEWAKENPVASRQVGNAFNIVTALIPAAKSYKAVKSIATGGIAAEMSATYTGRNILKEAAKTGVDPMVVMREAAESMPDRWWKQFVGTGGKKFHASLLKEPVDDMIAREAKIIQKYSAKGAPVEPGSMAKISEAKKKIAGLRNVKDLIDEIAKKPGEKGLKNKIPVVKYFASEPKQGLISRALLEKGSKASKTKAKSTLKKTLPVMAGSSVASQER